MPGAGAPLSPFAAPLGAAGVAPACFAPAGPRSSRFGVYRGTFMPKNRRWLIIVET